MKKIINDHVFSLQKKLIDLKEQEEIKIKSNKNNISFVELKEKGNSLFK